MSDLNITRSAKTHNTAPKKKVSILLCRIQLNLIMFIECIKMRSLFDCDADQPPPSSGTAAPAWSWAPSPVWLWPWPGHQSAAPPRRGGKTSG